MVLQWQRSRQPAAVRMALHVPAITVYFWTIKALSTALGESTSDYLVHAMAPELAVVLGFIGFVVSVDGAVLEAPLHRLVVLDAVVMVGMFGTMAADVLHVGFGVPYALSTALYTAVLGAVFVTWQKCEHTLSVHSIDTTRREAFYWAAVVATFALGTAVGDLTAITFNLGYAGSAMLFAALIVVPALGYWRFHLNPILAFWTAYVLTRPLGASVADWLAKPTSDGGLGIGAAAASVGFAVLIAILVGYLTFTGSDVRARSTRPDADAAHG